METQIRMDAMKWWNNMGLEDRFYKTIKNNHLIEGDKTRHPNSLTGYEIERIYSNEVKKP